MLKMVKQEDEKEIELVEETKEEKSMFGKIAGWSLKKKILVGVGAVGAGVVGALLLGSKGNQGENSNEEQFEDEDCEDYEDDGEFIDDDNEDEDRNAELGETVTE